jgi:uncharacterized protein (DUF1330 family)
MSACVIGHITVKDEEKWAQYRAQVPATLAPWHAELIFRGQLTEVLTGEHRHTDLVIIRFADPAAANAWYQSAAYQALIPLRQEAADLDLLTFTD